MVRESKAGFRKIPPKFSSQEESTPKKFLHTFFPSSSSLPPAPLTAVSKMSGSSTLNEAISPDPLTSPSSALYWTSYGTWYPIFRKHAPKSTVIDIGTVQPELLDWLESDTFVLPEGSGPSTASTSTAKVTALSASSSSSCSSSEDAEQADEGDESEDAEEQVVKLDALDKAIRDVVEKYDGAVFPKLNWSAPLDAGFMLPGNNLQCYHPEDVYLLLKSSEFVARDLEQMSHLPTTAPDAIIEEKVVPQLVLKKWFALNKSYEFRCFVRSSQLIAITQRDVTFFDHLQSTTLQRQIKARIAEFWEDVMVDASDEKDAEARWRLRDYVFDVYLTKDLGRVWLVDVNAWLPRTDPLLFAFDELDALHLADKARRRARQEVQDQHGEQHDAEEIQAGVVRFQLNPSSDSSATGSTATPDEQQDEWHHVDLRILSDRRMQSSGGTGATYSSNMVPKDLVDFAKNGSGKGADMSVDQIVQRWNDQVDSEAV